MRITRAEEATQAAGALLYTSESETWRSERVVGAMRSE